MVLLPDVHFSCLQHSLLIYPSDQVCEHTHLEELAHGLVVQAITAVEDDTLDGKGLGKILGGLCLAGTSWASWCPTQVHVNGPNQGTVAPVPCHTYLLSHACRAYKPVLIGL